MDAPEMRSRLLAIVVADVVGYSRLMSLDDRATVAALDAARAVFREHIAARGGRVIDMAGDSILAVFETAAGAVNSALAVQGTLSSTTAHVPEDHRMRHRIGVHLGDVIVKADGTVYGNGVNIAARLETLAAPGGIAVSESIRSAVHGKVDATFDDRGEHAVKNIAEPIRAYWVQAKDAARVQPSSASAGPASGPPSDKPSIAVLPFANISGDPQQDYFTDGITEDLITDLSRMRWLFVIACSSTLAYKGINLDVKMVGRELGARYLLQGSVRKGSDLVRINARLVDTQSGAQLWAERYDRGVSDMFALHDELCRLICASVGLSVPDAELARVRQKQPRNLNAWDRYLLALAALRETTKEGFQRATGLLSESIAMEPDFATAHARMAHAYVRAAHFGWAGPGSKAIQEARGHARTALALDPDNAFALDALASTHLYLGDVESAATAARRALTIDPSISAAYGTLVNALAFAGLADDAIATYRECKTLSSRDPDRSGMLMGLANAHFVNANYEDAIETARQHLALRPNWYGSHVLLAVCNVFLGKFEEAKSAGAEIVRLVPTFSIERARRRPFFRRAEDLKRLLDGLRLAGVPE